MMMFVLVAVGLLLVSQSSGFLFGSFFKRSKQDAVGSLSESCVSKALSGDCQFYTCFDERHPCESDNYALQYGWRFCSRFDVYRDRLTAQGQTWLNASRVCSMTRMLEYYRAGSIDCDDVEDRMKDVHAKCEAEHGICQGRLLTDNKEVFSDVFALNRRSATHFLMSAKQCTITKFREVASWFRAQFGTLNKLGQSFTPLLRELEQQMSNFKEEVREEIDRLTEIAETINLDDAAEEEAEETVTRGLNEAYFIEE